ncbi:ABC transporter substrate-binding protein [Anabaena sp. FACHB-709]|uniref:Iron(III) dicitrate-binding periplasmic protein n=2 Tax=Nostocaceae TaxID=1162 RepID=A0A1Z4KGW3_ANAVA|nr:MULTISPECIES: iron-siderophore ABC transporter substrate-binding protein [Nostocaceae]BAY68204.1 iron(III) dicitrate-binding periplasmic protein [Trichormus variabilis NIES-23]HBW29942.1 iron-siderophore ABC transporter substrate-binding protein [Nostoc sp. UBA8866]MBD2169714.1 iron-siderophore ABC transporter substrate-binding protein [Anabaena cylindrica FACHB-318]MBD2261867.1 iron-siderophore ABC transporter substrate-binding protein [Anabaena sp. FACHB-709]MBD2271452.1 iron-siderophore 
MSIKNNLFIRVFTFLHHILNYHQIKLILFSIITALIVIGCEMSTPNNVTINSVNATSEMRVVKHTMGETKIPLRPQRVVVLGGLDNILALGVKPIAATTFSDDNFADYLQDVTSGIEKIGINGQPNLEKILYLKPDLILGFSWDAELYGQLSQIAPTVLADQDSDWKDWLKKYAEAVGETAKAEKLLQEYDQRMESLRQQMGDTLSQTKVSLVNFWANFTRLYMNNSFGGSILKEIGLPRPKYQDKDKNHENISLELIPQINGDVIFLILGGHNESRLKQFTNHPLWSQLQAVQKNQVYPVTGDVWISAWGIIGANLVLDDLFKYLLE